LGALFLEGRGTERNDPLAHAWLSIARDNGSQNAGPLLDRLDARMSPDELAAARRLVTRARQTADSGG
jgi:TPR repeat protein